MRILAHLALHGAWRFDWHLDELEAAVADKSIERHSIACWWVKLPIQTEVRCHNLGPGDYCVSLSIPEHFVSDADTVERVHWEFGKERWAMEWAQDMGVTLEPTLGGVL